MAHSDTVNRILDAAEELFADRGFSETSLRMITGKAGVNLAAVNYHFGSKKSLIQAVFARFLTPFCISLEAAFDALEAESGEEHPSLEAVLTALTRTTVEMPRRHERSIAIYMRLQGLAYTQSQGHLRKFLEQEYNHTFSRFMRLLKGATPELSAVDRYWRNQFMLGATAFALSSSDALQEILFNKLGVETSEEDIVRQLVPFLASGMKAPPNHGVSVNSDSSAY